MRLPKTENILSFLNPIVLKDEISNLSNLKEIIQQYNPKYTVLPIDFFESVFQNTSIFKNLDNGAWVQLGVWRGGGALFFKSLMQELDINEKLYLIDTYGKIPISKLKHKKDVEFVNCFNAQGQVNYFNDVKNLFVQFKLNDNVYFIESDIHDIKKQQMPDKISFLFIDFDFYEPIYESLDILYDNVISGGIIIIDDYFLKLVNCKEAVDNFFFSKKIDLFKHSKKFSRFSLMFLKP